MSPSAQTDRVFLDANILFSAAYGRRSDLRQLWSIPGITLVTSDYAVGEARRNLTAIHLAELAELLRAVDIVPTPTRGLPSGIVLVAKDAPILVAAIEAGVSHLLTGDKRHFGHLYGQTVDGVLILRPRDYLDEALG